MTFLVVAIISLILSLLFADDAKLLFNINLFGIYKRW